MLRAAGRLESGASPWMGRAAAALGVSLLLHAVAAALLLVRVSPTLPPDQPPIEVELVQQEAVVQGAPAAPPPPAAEPPQPAPEKPGGDVRVAPLLPPAPPAPRAAPAPPPEINLGSGPQDVDPLNVTSRDVVPPAPDSRFRNLPPRYPPEAAQIGGEGVVQLLIHVTRAGLPSEVVVAHSSGYEALDQEARRAVLLWRFRPARNAGQAVPFDYLLNIRFSLGDRN